jgi:glycosyltransferase involved in cell wall biosynthesis
VSRIAYILTAFPTISETFVEAEFRALQSRGLPIDLYATRNFRESTGPGDDAGDRGLEVHRLPYLLSFEVAAALLEELLRSPGRLLRTLSRVVSGTLSSPRYLAHSLALFPKSVAFARRMERRGTIHVHGTWGHYPATVAYVVAELCGISMSFTVHASLDAHADPTFLDRKIARARFVLTCQAATRSALCALAPGCPTPIETVYHGVSFAAVPGPGTVPKADPPEIVSVGRLTPEKGFLDLVRACDLLRGKGIPFRLRIIGRGPQLQELTREIEQRQLTGPVRLEGVVPHGAVLQAMAGATLVALASYRTPNGYLDGIANTLVEAMACGTPVVSTEHDGSRELLEEGRLGSLVPQQDPAALAEALEKLLQDPRLRRERAAEGRRHVEAHFDRERNVERIAALFRGVLLDPSPGRTPGERG